MAGYLPASEGELVHQLPGSNRPNSFPRTALLGAEKVVYETRPGLLSLHPRLFWAWSPVVGFFFLLPIVTGFTSGFASVECIGLTFFASLFLLPWVWVVVDAARTGYALTDKRVIRRAGGDFSSAPYERVTGVHLERKGRNLVFELRPEAVPLGPRASRGSPTRLVWAGLGDAPGIETFAQSAVRFYRLRQQQKSLREAVVVSAMEDRIVCQYCGNLIAVVSLDPTNPKCPRCSAPVLVAPLGM